MLLALFISLLVCGIRLELIYIIHLRDFANISISVVL
jgi:hypothetical protein